MQGLAVVLLVTAGLGGLLAGQTRPELLGRWILTSPAACTLDVPGELSVRVPDDPAAAQGASPDQPFTQLEVERTCDGTSNVATYPIGIVRGVVPGVDDEGRKEGPSAWRSARWNGNALVLQRGRYTGPGPETGDWLETEEVWSLDAEGRLHLVMTTYRAGEGTTSREATYRRQ